MMEKESNNFYELISNINNWNDHRMGLFTYYISDNAWYEIQVVRAIFIDNESHPICKLYFAALTYNENGDAQTFERELLHEGLVDDCIKSAYKDCSENVHVNGLQ